MQRVRHGHGRVRHGCQPERWKVIAQRMHLAVTAYTASTDPNGLLGRYGEYTSKVNWGPDLGDTIEVFPDRADAIARQQYIEAFRCPFSSGYFDLQGTALLRLSCSDTPAQAAPVEAHFREAASGEAVQSPVSGEAVQASVSPSPSATVTRTVTAPGATAATAAAPAGVACSLVNTGVPGVGDPGGNSVPDGMCRVALYGNSGNGSVKLTDSSGRFTWYTLEAPSSYGG